MEKKFFHHKKIEFLIEKLRKNLFQNFFGKNKKIWKKNFFPTNQKIWKQFFFQIFFREIFGKIFITV